LGRNNYTNLSKELGIDFVAQPKLLETPKYALIISWLVWDTNNLNRLADNDDVVS
jgi:putative chitinase